MAHGLFASNVELIVITIAHCTRVAGQTCTCAVKVRVLRKPQTSLFSSPEAALSSVSTKNSDLWPSPILWASAENLFCILSQSDLSDLPLSMRNVKRKSVKRGLPVLIFGADQQERGLWGRECKQVTITFIRVTSRLKDAAAKFKPSPKSSSYTSRGLCFLLHM